MTDDYKFRVYSLDKRITFKVIFPNEVDKMTKPTVLELINHVKRLFREIDRKNYDKYYLAYYDGRDYVPLDNHVWEDHKCFDKLLSRDKKGYFTLYFCYVQRDERML